jgi:hypothetical protein
MKKTFRFLALSFALICGTVSAWADARPTDGPLDGASVGATVATTEGLQGVVTYVVNGWDDILNAYTVQIEGLDFDGLNSEDPITTLTIQTSFVEKWKTVQYKYYVNKIIDTQGIDPDDPTVAYKKAFYAMTELESLTFQATESAVPTSAFTFEVGDYAFYGCTSLNTLVLPDNVSRIGKYAFQGTIIPVFTIPAKCEEIGVCAFNDTKKLKEVFVSEAGNAELTTIDKQVFANSFVSVLDLSNATALQSINDQAFIFNVSDVNAQLKKVILPDVAHATNPFVSLGANGTCFANCMALQEIENLDKTNVTDINPGAFQNCVKLGADDNGEVKPLKFPATASIYTDGITSPFLNTPLLKKITFADGWGKTGEIIGSGVYASTDGKKIKYNSTTKKYTLEDYTLTAADKAAELSHLEEIEFEGAVYGEIEDYAFGSNDPKAACTGLATLTFGGTIYEGTEIGEGAFQNCVGLETLTFAGPGTAAAPVYAFEISATGKKGILIDDYAFAGTKIADLNFKNIKLKGKNEEDLAFTVSSHAFACENLANVEFGNIIYDNGATYTMTFYLENEAFESDVLEGVVFGDITAKNAQSTFTVGNGEKVFKELNEDPVKPTGVLKTVEFGHLTCGSFTINQYAFQSVYLTNVAFGDITNPAKVSGRLYIGYSAFGYEYVAATYSKAEEKTVTIGVKDAAAGEDGDHNGIYGIVQNTTDGGSLSVDIYDLAFFGDKLATVTIGDINAYYVGIGYTGDLAMGPFGGDFAEKTVTIGNIGGVTTSVSAYAFQGDKLTSVELGAISGKSVTIGQYAFSGNLLTNVKMGDITSATEATFGTYSFANTSTEADGVLEETVKIGELATAALSIDTKAFQGPQNEGSTFNVTIGKTVKVEDEDGNEIEVLTVGISKNPTIVASTFVGPAYGTTTYTLGDINVATTGIAGKAFVGSKDNKTDKNNNTDVTIGDYNKKFQNVNTFTNVDDLVAKSWNCNQNLTTFQKPKTLTILNDVTATLDGGGLDSNNLVSLTIGGNVVSPAAIQNFGEAVRHIEFTSDDPEVYAGAIFPGAFELASDAALFADETISVIYRVETKKNSNAIFDKYAFSSWDADNKNVVLYTDQWSLEHTFQNVEIGGEEERVYRIMLSASDVAPGEDIAATCVKGANGKYSYGRLYIPAGKGMRYKVSAECDETTKKNGVNLFSATISGADIYMHQLTVMEGYYWIDATESAQTLIVRTSDVSAAQVTVEAESVTEAEAQEMDAAGTVILDNDWFDATSAKKNALKYATSAITPAEFQNDATTYNKNIYVMANPAKNNLAFALYDQTNSETKDLNKGSIYVVSRTNKAARLNVIWPEGIDEESEATAINAIETEESNDAIYNLQGVRVNNAQKGIFIINGKKVVK